MELTCPCGSGTPYAACCGPFHEGAEPPTAERLMRARYCAFVRKDAAFLLRTLHPVKRALAGAGDFRAAFGLTWTGLEILDREAGGEDDDTGTVTFRASFIAPDGRALAHEERSRFVRAQGAWVYREAE